MKRVKKTQKKLDGLTNEEAEVITRRRAFALLTLKTESKFKAAQFSKFQLFNQFFERVFVARCS